jgi:hypothetical protein
VTISGRRPIAFFALAFALAAPFWVLGALVPTPEDAPVPLPFSAFQFLAPFTAAAILVWREEGPAAVGRLLGRAVDVRSVRPAGWWLPALLLLPAVYLLSYLTQLAIGRPLPDPEFAVESLVVLIGLFLVTAFFEEVGWTGYALGPMQSRIGPVRAALVIGVAWAAFHLVADLQGGRALDWIAWQRLAGIAIRVLIVWIHNGTGGSLFTVIVFHATDNVSWLSFPSGGSHYDPALVALPLLLIAAVVAARHRLEPTADSGRSALEAVQPPADRGLRRLPDPSRD